MFSFVRPSVHSFIHSLIQYVLLHYTWTDKICIHRQAHTSFTYSIDNHTYINYNLPRQNRNQFILIYGISSNVIPDQSTFTISSPCANNLEDPFFIIWQISFQHTSKTFQITFKRWCTLEEKMNLKLTTDSITVIAISIDIQFGIGIGLGVLTSGSDGQCWSPRWRHCIVF